METARETTMETTKKTTRAYAPSHRGLKPSLSRYVSLCMSLSLSVSVSASVSASVYVYVYVYVYVPVSISRGDRVRHGLVMTHGVVTQCLALFDLSWARHKIYSDVDGRLVCTARLTLKLVMPSPDLVGQS